jgi:conjugative transfer region protein (TIGR03748 family)
MQRMCPICRFSRSCHTYLRSAARFGLIVCATVSGTVAAVSQPEIPIARYSSVQALPTREQADPLAEVVTATFPVSVESVGAAVVQVLKASGYRIADDGATQAVRTVLFGLPLPQAHQTLGPLPLRTVLETLAGPGYRLIEDPVHRLITFDRCGESSLSRIPNESDRGRSE